MFYLNEFNDQFHKIINQLSGVYQKTLKTDLY